MLFGWEAELDRGCFGVSVGTTIDFERLLGVPVALIPDAASFPSRCGSTGGAAGVGTVAPPVGLPCLMLDASDDPNGMGKITDERGL